MWQRCCEGITVLFLVHSEPLPTLERLGGSWDAHMILLNYISSSRTRETDWLCGRCCSYIPLCLFHFPALCLWVPKFSFLSRRFRHIYHLLYFACILALLVYENLLILFHDLLQCQMFRGPSESRWLSSGLLRRVVWWKFTDVSEVLAASIIRAEISHLSEAHGPHFGNLCSKDFIHCTGITEHYHFMSYS
jgi:hypothetical protein